MPDHLLKVAENESKLVKKLITYGSFWVAFIIIILVLGYDMLLMNDFRIRSIVGLLTIAYLAIGLYLATKKRQRTVSWMLIILYSSIAFSTMLHWGINTAIGMFSTCFIIILTGILLGSRFILPVTLSIIALLFGVQTIHFLTILTPDLPYSRRQLSYVDVVTYVTMLGIFSLITWLSDSQIEKSLKRAQLAKVAIRTQKELLAVELQKESSRLQEVQLKELQQLYRFATLGQNAAATLHELSNHLSVLNMDIDDLKQQHRNSRAIANAKEGIEQINVMVRQIRRKLNSYDDSKHFKVGPIVRRVVKDLSDTSKNKSIELTCHINKLGNTQITGDPLALIQILTVLITNALEACTELARAKIVVRLDVIGALLTISVIDNGIGISKQTREILFTPTKSSKPTGMGIGLYIAHHLAVSHFRGTLRLEDTKEPSTAGAHFTVQLPTQSNRGIG